MTAMCSHVKLLTLPPHTYLKMQKHDKINRLKISAIQFISFFSLYKMQLLLSFCIVRHSIHSGDALNKSTRVGQTYYKAGQLLGKRLKFVTR